MSFKDVQRIADEAAESARLDNDLNDTIRLLAQSVSELARAMDTMRRELKAQIDNIKPPGQ